MEDQSRMMLYPQNYGMNMGGEDQTATSPAPSTEETQTVRSHADINVILDQIMNITDQSLDEAQVPFVTAFSICQTLHRRTLNTVEKFSNVI